MYLVNIECPLKALQTLQSFFLYIKIYVKSFPFHLVFILLKLTFFAFTISNRDIIYESSLFYRISTSLLSSFFHLRIPFNVYKVKLFPPLSFFSYLKTKENCRPKFIKTFSNINPVLQWQPRERKDIKRKYI